MSRTQECTLLAFLVVQVSVSQGGRRLTPQKAPLKMLRVLDPIKITHFVVPVIRKEAATGNDSSQSSNLSFSSGRGKPNFKGSKGHFRPHSRRGGRGNPSPQWLLKSLPQSISRRSNLFFQKRLANKQMFKQRVRHYHQWLRSSICFKTKICQSPSDLIRIQGPSKRTSSGHLSGKCKIPRVLQLPVSCTQAPPKVEASNRLKQAKHFSTSRKVQNGNSQVHQNLPDSRGMGVVDRPIRHIPSHPHPPKLKEIGFATGHRCSSSPPFH